MVEAELMPTSGTLGVFVLATLALIAIPGPSTFFLLSRGLTAGRRAALLSALGVETGTILFVCLTAFGLSALIASSTYAFAVLHYAGAAYLLFLAWRTVRRRADTGSTNTPVTTSFWSSYRQGFFVGASNPKVALFFLAFLPQFVRPDRGSTTMQVLILGGVFVALGLAADTVHSVASAAIGRWLARRPSFFRIRDRVEAVSYAGLAGWALLSGSPGRTR
jgi:threonine/homoserine/homoserine lactone efflux protein